MAITVECPQCGKRYQIPEAQAGQTGRCSCGAEISVPERAGPAVPEGPPEASIPGETPELQLKIADVSAPGVTGSPCPSCGADPVPGVRFCLRCGAALAGGETKENPDQPASSSKPEGCGRVLLALVLGTATFLATLLGLSARPGQSMGFLVWSMSGAMAGLIAAWIAPRRRWYVAAPLVVVLEVGLGRVAALLAGFGSSMPPRGMDEGIKAGVLVGLALVGVCRPSMPSRRRTGLLLAVVAVFACAYAVSCWSGYR